MSPRRWRARAGFARAAASHPRQSAAFATLAGTPRARASPSSTGRPPVRDGWRAHVLPPRGRETPIRREPHRKPISGPWLKLSRCRSGTFAWHRFRMLTFARFSRDLPAIRRVGRLRQRRRVDRTPSIGSRGRRAWRGPNFRPSRQAPNRLAQIRLREPRREQHLHLLAALTTTHLEQLRRVLRIQVRTEQRQHRKLELATRHASKRPRILLAHARHGDAPTCRRFTKAERPNPTSHRAPFQRVSRAAACAPLPARLRNSTPSIGSDSAARSNAGSPQRAAEGSDGPRRAA